MGMRRISGGMGYCRMTRYSELMDSKAVLTLVIFY
jgi:hypothetical protein